MIYRLFQLSVCIVLLAVLSACESPKLARTELGQTESQWKSYIQESYSEWEPPPTTPLVAENLNKEPQADAVIDIVPDPAFENTFSPIDDEGIEILDIPSIDISPETSLDELTPVSMDTIPETYTIQKGDTLWSISYRFYNNGKRWEDILEANKDLIPSPEKLAAGTVIKIPSK